MNGGAFVDAGFSAAEAEFDFGAALLEIDAEGDDGESFFGGALAPAFDFVFVEEELAGTLGIVVIDVALFIRLDMRADEEEFAGLEVGISVFEGHSAGIAQGFHLGAGQGQAGLEGLEDVVVPADATVGYDDFFTHGDGTLNGGLALSG